ncbi:conserved hypothetical protein [Burkholderia pseudomallei 1106b]|uniref:Uncharacterized protein n=2 Tax=Burkholderia pseudomallei TaxID=28450 RepID=A0A0E1VZI9_BURPE|nr:conserved hypothetical protein [Burkholderia pseudomallei 1106a]EBA45528.1 hypothetical protein BURPS305_1962 [Burkholderia pseudomallei 305]EDO93704.1 conserved hypothetical protein [Burkholderia pseudomallei Pasteur 52237]EEH25771.1 conserved hypothetical protein [Burkholderia pseudomallei Pakistan 9]EES25703.1 conserved hypothetical protein [Burkholderia pseudomallei 1106b]EET06318.1 conserved hypothetical protein [Burkholderia pseudomallei 1710a]
MKPFACCPSSPFVWIATWPAGQVRVSLRPPEFGIYATNQGNSK